jgi:hypothetical protein
MEMNLNMQSPFPDVLASIRSQTGPREFLEYIHDILVPALETSTDELLALDKTSQHFPTALLPTMVGQLLDSGTTGSVCHICDPTNHQHQLLIDGLRHCQDTCGEILVRQHRIMRHRYLCGDDDEAKTRLNGELNQYVVLLTKVPDQIAVVFQSLGMTASASLCSTITPYLPYNESEPWLYQGCGTDCLKRTGLHWALDITDFVLENEYVTAAIHYYRDRIDHQDILGRTALHIACQRNEEDVVRTYSKQERIQDCQLYTTVYPYITPLQTARSTYAECC